MRKEETTRFWRVYSTLHELLKDRGYTIIVSGQCISDLKALESDYAVDGEIVDKQSLNFVCQHETTQKLLMVCFLSDQSIGVKQITKVYEKMLSGKIPHCIFIYPNILTPSAKRDLEKIQRVTMEYFSEDELQMNITKYCFMPKHEVLNELEKKNVFQRNKSSRTSITKNIR